MPNQYETYTEYLDTEPTRYCIHKAARIAFKNPDGTEREPTAQELQLPCFTVGGSWDLSFDEWVLMEYVQAYFPDGTYALTYDSIGKPKNLVALGDADGEYRWGNPEYPHTAEDGTTEYKSPGDLVEYKWEKVEEFLERGIRTMLQEEIGNRYTRLRTWLLEVLMEEYRDSYQDSLVAGGKLVIHPTDRAEIVAEMRKRKRR